MSKQGGAEERFAPVQGYEPGGRIPWALHARIWQAYAALGHGQQSAQRIAERGGFAWGEAAWMLGEFDPLSQKPFTDRERAKFHYLQEQGTDHE
jgi:hypothetical protein